MKKEQTPKSRKIRKILGITALVIAIPVLVVVGYVAAVFLSYSRIPDNTTLEITNHATANVPLGEELTALSYNIGFAAYTPEYSFFMDGGTESRAFSKQAVLTDMTGIIDTIKEVNPDILMVEELDLKATRSYHVNEKELMDTAMADYNATYAVNWDSAYLMYPVTKPHGKSLTGMGTYAKYTMTDALRRSLPVEDSFMKIVDLDRCYSVTRYPCEADENGVVHDLVVYTAHLSAYTSDGVVATEQIQMLVADMQKEVDADNYCILAGDFNKDLLGDSASCFGVTKNGQNWAQPFPTELLEGTSLTLQVPYDESNPVPTCRDANEPYSDTCFVVTVDGFVVSDRVHVVQAEVVDTGFAYSDHNPVVLTFTLE